MEKGLNFSSKLGSEADSGDEEPDEDISPSTVDGDN